MPPLSLRRAPALLALIVLFLLASLAPLAPAQASVGGPAPAALVQVDNRASISAVFKAINDYRVSKGLRVVRYNATVAQMSQEWVDGMAARQAIEHSPTFLSDPRVKGWNAAGEVIAVRWDRKAAELVTWWKSSPGHNAVLLDPRMTVVGIGVSFTDSTNNYQMAGLANFFGYAKEPSATYSSPQAYFNSGNYYPSSIDQKYAAVGGAAVMGQKVGAVRTGLVGGGRLQEYQRGAIVWSPASGAAVISGSIRWLWDWAGAQNGFLGYPTADEVNAGGGSHQAFKGGRIAWTPQAGSVYLRGAFASAWGAAGAAGSPVRYPIANERAIAGGSVQDFQAGQFYWSSAGGARFVTGGIKATWEGFGGSKGYMGFPSSNEIYGNRAGGVRQNFVNGVITWTPFAGSRITFGTINWVWNQLGAQSGSLGYPVTDEYAVPGGSAQRFEFGTITWTPAGTKVAYF